MHNGKSVRKSHWVIVGLAIFIIYFLYTQDDNKMERCDIETRQVFRLLDRLRELESSLRDLKTGLDLSQSVREVQEENRKVQEGMLRKISSTLCLRDYVIS